MTDSGILYVATGRKCCAEAIENANRTRLFCPSFSISIKTDQIEVAEKSNAFDHIVRFSTPSLSYRDKISGLIDLPYEQTLFLDCDACLIRDVVEFFSLFAAADLAAAMAPVRHPPGWTDSSVPQLFPELNTGVLLIRRSPKWTLVVESWLALYDALVQSHSQYWDQASFRSVLWSAISKHQLCFLHLPSETNLRTTKPWIAGRGMPISVIHGRYPSDEFLPFVNYLNHDIDRFRTWNEWLSLYPNTQIRPRFDRTFG